MAVTESFISVVKLQEILEDVIFFSLPKGYSRKRGAERKFVTNGDFISAAVEQFMKILKNPGTVVCRWGMIFVESDYPNVTKPRLIKQLSEALSHLSHQISVFEFHIFNGSDPDNVLQFLRFLKPGTLESMIFQPRSSDETQDFSEIAETEQWKKAKMLRILGEKATVPYAKTEHFGYLSIPKEHMSLQEAQHLITVSALAIVARP